MHVFFVVYNIEITYFKCWKKKTVNQEFCIQQDSYKVKEKLKHSQN